MSPIWSPTTSPIIPNFNFFQNEEDQPDEDNNNNMLIGLLMGFGIFGGILLFCCLIKFICCDWTQPKPKNKIDPANSVVKW